MNEYFDIALNLGQRSKTVPLLLFLSLVLRQSLVLQGQRWASTFAHSLTILLLPVTTYVITSAISGNIALSLGMVGALSIVRFRNPVKSPFELAVYFICITMGITASVSVYWLFLLCASIAIVLFSVNFLNYFYKVFLGKPWLTYSFAEGNELSTITVTSSTAIEWLEKHEAIISIVNDENYYEYCLASHDIGEILSLHRALKNIQEVTSCKVIR